MDPTVAVPAHFTLEIAGVAAAGLVLAWGLINKRYISAAGALALGTAQALHAGSFVAADDAAGIVILRLAGLALIGVGAFDFAPRWRSLGAGLGAMFIAALWSAFAGGSAADLSLGPHLLAGVGAVVLLVWGWNATRPSVRLRVLAAFVIVLAIAVVVTGGAVARVAVLDKRNEEYARLGPTVLQLRQGLIDTATDLARRASQASPSVADELARGQASKLAAVKISGEELAAVVDRNGKVRGARGATDGLDPASLASSDAFTRAMTGLVATSFDVVDGGVAAVGMSPVFRPGGSPSAQDTIGAVAVARTIKVSTLRDNARTLQSDAEVAVVDASGDGSGTMAIRDLRALRATGRGNVEYRSVEAKGASWPVAVTRLGSSDVSLAAAVSGASVVAATTDLVRTLLIALLASALLAVLVALWLSARITRPMLDLVEEGERLKTDFLASVSHELRTPLTPIRGYTEILRKGRVPARRATGYLDEIGQAAQRLERIVTLLVDVAALEAGRFYVDIKEVSALELLEEAGERWGERSRSHPVRVNAAAELPGVNADPDAIGRVLDELIDNAIKFSPNGGTIELTARPSDRGVEFAVRDEGAGVEADKLSELGHAFEQVDSGDTRRFGGLGLGLTYVHGVLTTHNSRLSIESTPGQGTTCSFTLSATGMVTRMPAKAARTSARKASKSRAR